MSKIRTMWWAAGAAMALAACGGGGGDGGSGGGGAGGGTTVALGLKTSPAGLYLELDGAAAPASIDATPGATHTVTAPTRQHNCGANGAAPTTYTFASWSDGGTVSHTITVPSAATDYTANYNAAPDTNNAPTVAILTTTSTGKVGVAQALSGTAQDSDGRIVKVEFLDGSTVLGEDTSAPYSFQWTPTTSGAKSLTLRATDECGLATSSAVVTVNVAP